MSTHPSQGIGYARVANKITNYLADIPGVEVVYYAFQNYKKQTIKDRFIDPRIKFYDAVEIDPETPRGFGYKGIVPSIINEKPDILFLYGGIAICNHIIDLIPIEHIPPKKFLYVDITYKWQAPILYDTLKSIKYDHIWTFLNCWKDYLINDRGFDSNIVDVLPHGVDFDNFIDVPQNEAKAKLGLKPDDFLVVNMNRNSPRKNWTVTLSSFLQLVKRQNMNTSIKLFCGCDIKHENGYDIIRIIELECMRLKMDVDHIFANNLLFCSRPYGLTEEEINNVYNAADVGMNTTYGEGFGLTTMEHLYFNRPQVVTNVPALKETIGKYAYLVEPKIYKQLGEMNYPMGGFVCDCDPTDFTDALEHYYINRDDRPNAREDIKERYSWENVYKVLDRFFTNGSVQTSECSLLSDGCK
jgi:glycosyltransferase involved in cell wall biosynthesis